MDLSGMSDRAAGRVLKWDRILPFSFFWDALTVPFRFGAKSRNRRAFDEWARAQGWTKQRQQLGRYQISVSGSGPGVELKLPGRSQEPFTFEVRREVDSLDAPLVQLDSGRATFDLYFGKRFAHPNVAACVRRQPEALDPLVCFLKKWGMTLFDLSVTERRIRLRFRDGIASSRHAYLPLRSFQRICPDLLQLADGVERLKQGARSAAMEPSSAERLESRAADTERQEEQKKQHASVVLRRALVSVSRLRGALFVAPLCCLGLGWAPLPRSLQVLLLVFLGVATLGLAVSTNRWANEPIALLLRGRRPLGAAIWGQFALTLIPGMGFLPALEELARCRHGELELSEHDSNPERLGVEMEPRVRLYRTLVLVWPVVAVSGFLFVLPELIATGTFP